MKNIEEFIELSEPEVDFDATMEAFARNIILAAQGDGVKLSDKIEAFKVVQPYHAARKRHEGKHNGETGPRRTGRTMADFKEDANLEQ